MWKRKRANRKPSRPRAVISLSIPLEPDYVLASRAAGMLGESLSEFMREAIRQRTNRTIGKEADDTPTDLAA